MLTLMAFASATGVTWTIGCDGATSLLADVELGPFLSAEDAEVDVDRAKRPRDAVLDNQILRPWSFVKQKR
jgi:hypothetical protein